MATYESQYTGAQIDSAYALSPITFATAEAMQTAINSINVGQLCIVQYDNTIYYKKDETTLAQIGTSGVNSIGGASGIISLGDGLAIANNTLSATTTVQIYRDSDNNMIITDATKLPTAAYTDGVKLVFTTVAPTSYQSGYLYIITAA